MGSVHGDLSQHTIVMQIAGQKICENYESWILIQWFFKNMGLHRWPISMFHQWFITIVDIYVTISGSNSLIHMMVYLHTGDMFPQLKRLVFYAKKYKILG
jgi:hypothetical protein